MLSVCNTVYYTQEIDVMWLGSWHVCRLGGCLSNKTPLWIVTSLLIPSADVLITKGQLIMVPCLWGVSRFSMWMQNYIVYSFLSANAPIYLTPESVKILSAASAANIKYTNYMLKDMFFWLWDFVETEYHFTQRQMDAGEREREKTIITILAQHLNECPKDTIEQLRLKKCV